MKRKGLGAVLVTAAVAVGLAIPSGASAISDRDYCEQVLQGTYVKNGSTSTCTVRDQQGNSHVYKTEEDAQKGSFKSSHPRDEKNCVDNPGGDPCPPGQN